MTIEYRLLTPPEWHRLNGVVPRDYIPSPETSVVAIAEENGQIIGVLPLQLQWHMEPLVLLTPRASFVRLKEILDKQLENFPGSCYYAFVDSEKVAKMAELSGMKPQPTLVFKGEVA